MALWQKHVRHQRPGPRRAHPGSAAVDAGGGRGTHRAGSSAAGVRGQPGTAPYSAAKGALERWGESMACEIAPFGLGVTVLVAGTYDTEIITDAGTTDDRNFDGPYARLHDTMNTRGRFAISFARPPERFTDGLLKALDDQGAFRRRGVGPDASMLLASNRILPSSGMHHMSRIVLGIPRQGSMRDGAWPLTAAKRRWCFVARVLPQPVLQRLAAVAARFTRRKRGTKGIEGVVMGQLFDDLEDFGSSTTRSPATCATRTPNWRGCAARNRSSDSRHRARFRTRNRCRCSSCTATRISSRCCATTRRSRRRPSSRRSARCWVKA